MRWFELLINDDRYSVANLRLVEACDEDQACRKALQVLEETPHHLDVEVWEEDVRLAIVTRQL